ncbi:MAG TPA: uracil-DNA glycosylase [Aminivibrio sp.]|jgi:DNA polymerase|uniref:uracil-DNA glycosylase n=1 Tax=Aminivibrio sp. TaxID=1872489 RepID=UPI002B2189B6|nr:uracil-DNA glycosylase [Aminivibrio sp.]MDD3515229.1 uracil-DNA glycosylase [Synergistaceae bacterium]MEA4952084.1 uracil-DNA glycosylase [Aminivibrio sp.]NCB15593.1 uracil-DNA glycosylase [Synergistales bacterium]HPF86027.1 uracil-DNA glycosylase [Aminivibrio sp.]
MFQESFEELRRKASACTLCPLSGTRARAVFGEGPENAPVMLVGEAPGATEDRTGSPFTGRSGKLLTALLDGEGLPREKIFITNMVKCRPPENRLPAKGELAACRPFLAAQVARLRPRLLLSVGNVPTRDFLSSREGITTLRGRFHTCLWQGIPLTVRPLFHPSYLLRNRSFAEGTPGHQTVRDIREILRFLMEAIPGF